MATHDKPEECGESEFGGGPGMFTPPNLDYERGLTNFNFEGHRTRNDQLRDMAAAKRSNLTDPSETLEEMYTALGNPDRFGGHPPLVRQSAQYQPADGSNVEPVVIFQREG